MKRLLQLQGLRWMQRNKAGDTRVVDASKIADIVLEKMLCQSSHDNNDLVGTA